MKTFFETSEKAEQNRKWKIIDVAGKPVGRVASEIAGLLRGKHRPDYSPHTDGGDFVIVLNVEQVVFTGKKADQKLYQRHTGYIGGVKSEKASALLKRKPEEVIRHAVEGMLPDGPMGYKMMNKLKIYKGTVHPHAAQQPEEYTLKFV